ncbi:MAG: hypothetical protein EOO06_15005 [Chitinophagaceae bacterium]|nr:MAG: hypothetical protein EOO06_15005 [Chitinophagaceae bacterium]
MGISKVAAQKKLSVLWFINAAVLALLFIIFTVTGKFEENVSAGWEWYSQNIIPILTMMIGTFYITVNKVQEEKRVDRFYYNLALGISVFYLVVLYLTVLLAPVAFNAAELSIIELFEKSKIYLVLIQGVLTFSLGLFFVKES